MTPRWRTVGCWSQSWPLVLARRRKGHLWERTWVLRKLVQVFQPEQVYDLKQTARGNNLSNDLFSFLTVLTISDQEAAFRERHTVSRPLGKPFRCRWRVLRGCSWRVTSVRLCLGREGVCPRALGDQGPRVPCLR